MQEREAVVEPRRLGHVLLQQAGHRLVQANGEVELGRCYQGFVQRLTQAVEQQQRVAAHAAVQVERAEAIVRGHEVRAAGLRKLIERRLRQSEANDARNEQKESDDRAVRASWNRLTAPGPARFL